MTSEAEKIIDQALQSLSDTSRAASAVAAALRDAGMLVKGDAKLLQNYETGWEYGWRAFFANGEEYEWLACDSREDAEHAAREYQKEEDRGSYTDGHLTYSVWRRRVVAPGPWSPIPEGTE